MDLSRIYLAVHIVRNCEVFGTDFNVSSFSNTSQYFIFLIMIILKSFQKEQIAQITYLL